MKDIAKAVAHKWGNKQRKQNIKKKKKKAFVGTNTALNLPIYIVINRTFNVLVAPLYIQVILKRATNFQIYVSYCRLL